MADFIPVVFQSQFPSLQFFFKGEDEGQRFENGIFVCADQDTLDKMQAALDDPKSTLRNYVRRIDRDAALATAMAYKQSEMLKTAAAQGPFTTDMMMRNSAESLQAKAISSAATEGVNVTDFTQGLAALVKSGMAPNNGQQSE